MVNLKSLPSIGLVIWSKNYYPPNLILLLEWNFLIKILILKYCTSNSNFFFFFWWLRGYALRKIKYYKIKDMKHPKHLKIAVKKYIKGEVEYKTKLSLEMFPSFAKRFAY